MKKIFLCLILFAGTIALQQAAFAQNFSWGYYYSYDTKLSMTALKESPDAKNDTWRLSVTIHNKDNKEVCTLTPTFAYIDNNFATGGGYTFTFSELSPALIISPINENSTEADLACGYGILGTYANLCPEAKSHLKQMTITILEVFDPAETVPRRIRYSYEGKEAYNNISYDSVDFFKTLVGKTVTVRYRLEQNYNEHDSFCIQEKVFYVVDDVSLEN